MICLRCDVCGRTNAKKSVFLREEYQVPIRVGRGRRRALVTMFVSGGGRRRDARRRLRTPDLCCKCLLAAVKRALDERGARVTAMRRRRSR